MLLFTSITAQHIRVKPDILVDSGALLLEDSYYHHALMGNHAANPSKISTYRLYLVVSPTTSRV
ncbi:hypothetical protein GOP47_0004806 [Adiantum capillus-veneris]|uniref:Uncharacterized protein n=1 Tax=Adiantum capillus-veneris TaxID=13818 RepID=A0A9D4V4Q5_ADICA|nr:hypothetical protein GOP47_0004805 [Adiantum capillus-veneris]KAI5079327.1 hypothetical protein GOP47_0004806 [Adiantum capillus-veneris]